MSATGTSTSASGTFEIEVPANTAYIGFAVGAATISGGSYAVVISSFKHEPISLVMREKKYLNGSLQATDNYSLTYKDEGVYRYELTHNLLYDQIKISLHYYATDTGQISETKTIDLNSECIPTQSEDGIHLSWMVYPGGFDYFTFTAYPDHLIDITDSGETEENIFPDWPNSHGEFADTIRKQTFRTSRRQVLVRSQHVTKEQLAAIKYIKTSPLVQIVNSIYDRRTVLVDTESFTERKGEDKLYSISFTITYTDDVPSQSV
jgi:hypothetical protein